MWTIFGKNILWCYIYTPCQVHCRDCHVSMFLLVRRIQVYWLYDYVAGPTVRQDWAWASTDIAADFPHYCLHLQTKERHELQNRKNSHIYVIVETGCLYQRATRYVSRLTGIELNLLNALVFCPSLLERKRANPLAKLQKVKRHMQLQIQIYSLHNHRYIAYIIIKMAKKYIG